LAPTTLAAAPAQTPAAKTSGTAAAGAAVAAKPAPKPKAPLAAPAADHLVLSAPGDQPDPAAVRLTEMDKRIADLTLEITQLRSELVAERQRAAEAAQEKERLSAGWIVAILALLGLGLGGLMTWQRKRNGMPWEKSSWEPAATTMPDELPATRAAPPPAPVTARAAIVEPSPAAREAGLPAGITAAERPAAPYRPAARDMNALAPRATPPSASARSSFEELSGTGSTLTPGAGGPKTTIEVTELHADDPEFGKMHTVFLEQGNLESPVFTAALPGAAMDTHIPGPRPVPGGGIPGDGNGSRTRQSPITQLPPISDLPPMPPPTIVAPEQRHGAFSFDEGPYTQTPTMLVLDLDLTTRVLPAEDGEAGKSAVPPKDAKGVEPSGGNGGAEPRKGYKNGQ
jgi:hypothetical protein